MTRDEIRAGVEQRLEGPLTREAHAGMLHALASLEIADELTKLNAWLDDLSSSAASMLSIVLQEVSAQVNDSPAGDGTIAVAEFTCAGGYHQWQGGGEPLSVNVTNDGIKEYWFYDRLPADRSRIPAGYAHEPYRGRRDAIMCRMCGVSANEVAPVFPLSSPTNPRMRPTKEGGQA